MPPENSPLRSAVFQVVMSDYCEFFFMAVIVANVVILMMTHADMSVSWQTFMSSSNIVFTGIFVMEALLKMIAIGVWPYLKVKGTTLAC